MKMLMLKKRLNCGREVEQRSLTKAFQDTEYADHIPCYCSCPSITIMYRGSDLDAIYWVECLACGRQFPPGWTRDGSVERFKILMGEEIDPYDHGLPKPKKSECFPLQTKRTRGKS